MVTGIEILETVPDRTSTSFSPAGVVQPMRPGVREISF